MVSPSLPNHLYTVGWICALAIERAAAQAMLDEVHGDPKYLHPTDQNIYILGRIKSHKIVIACLPAGDYGIGSAAAAAQQMVSSFGGIKFGLLVGIGGGIPQEGYDIRLGDVVISKPDGQMGGVVQYDRGKALGEDHFVRMGSLNAPPRVLLNALNALAAKNMLQETRIPEFLGVMTDKYPEFAHPGPQHDPLYHHDESGDRPSLNPKVHHGLIASGNQVIKDAVVRDRLRRELGSNVLCFEMEAAGLMNTFSCLVIRGISDYADYYKNDQWQPYAAATAAVCAKELLCTIHVHEVDQPGIAVDEIDCFQFLPFQEMNSRQQDIEDAAPGTCSWLLEDVDYVRWKSQTNGLLWLTGKPGTGKSTLLKYALLKEAEAEQHNQHPVPKLVLSCFFHGRGSEIQRTPLGFYRSLLHQLLGRYQEQVQSQLVDVVQNFRRTHEGIAEVKAPWTWHPNELQDLLRSALRKVRETHAVQIMVDALDECSKADTLVLEDYLKHIRADSAAAPLQQLSICITCRHFPMVQWRDGLEISVESKNQSDIRTYLRDKLNAFEDEMDRQALEEEMVHRSASIFLWVKLVYPNVLWQQRQGLSLEQILHCLRSTPTELHNLFHNILQRLTDDGGVETDRMRSQQLFQWLCFSRRPLSVPELQWAMNMILVGHDCPSLQRCLLLPDAIRDERQMIKRLNSLSGGLAEIYDDHHGVPVAQLIHQSVKDYLIDRGFQFLDRSLWSPAMAVGQAHTRMSQACIRYLSMEEILQQQGETPEREFPFLNYATMSWIPHAEVAEAINISQEHIPTSFGWPSGRIIDSWVRIASQRHKEWPIPKTTLLHATARHGLTSAVTAQLWGASFLRTVLLSFAFQSQFLPILICALLQRALRLYLLADGNADSKDGLGRTPLSLAAARGHTMVVQQLLSRPDVDINSQDYKGRTPLSWATAGGHQEVTRLLLSRPDTLVNAPDHLGRTPLLWSATSGREAITVRLLQKAADITATDSNGTTALHVAAREGHEALALLLLDQGINLEAKDKQGRTALHEAALYGRKTMVQLLLDKGANVSERDKNGDTVLHRVGGNSDQTIARRLGDKKQADLVAVAELLLRHRLDLIHKTDRAHGRTALHRAAGNGRLAVVRLLLKKGACIDTLDVGRWSALEVAIQNRQEAMVRLLLEKGATIGVEATQIAATTKHESIIRLLSDPVYAYNYFEETVLVTASRTGDEQAVRQLLDQGAVVTRRALTVACEAGHKAVAQLLVENGAIAPLEALKVAAGGGHEAIVQLLLAKGFDATPQALKAAVDNGRVTMVQLLLQAGVDATSQALAAAAGRGDEVIVQLLLQNEAEVTPLVLEEAAGNAQEAMVRLLLQKGVYATAEALRAAAAVDNEAIVYLLLEKGADVTPLALAAAARVGNEAIVDLFLEEKPNLTMEPGGDQALYHAAFGGNKAIVQLLLNKGTNINSQVRLSWGGLNGTALHVAALEGHEAIVQLLLQQGADINVMGYYAATALHEAARKGHEGIVRLLLEKGADVNAEHEFQHTPLQLAAENGYNDVVRLLLEKGADANAQQYHAVRGGPLYQAAAYGHNVAVQLLLEHGADANAKDLYSMSETALHVATRKGYEEVVRLLVEHGADVAERDGKGMTALDTAQRLYHHGSDNNNDNDEDGDYSADLWDRPVVDQNRLAAIMQLLRTKS